MKIMHPQARGEGGVGIAWKVVKYTLKQKISLYGKGYCGKRILYMFFLKLFFVNNFLIKEQWLKLAGSYSGS